MNLRHFRAPALFLVVSFSTLRLSACGDYFPNNLLDGGDAAVLAAPYAHFEREMERMHLATNSFQAVMTTNSYGKESADSELDDLRAALEQTGTPTPAARAIIEAHRRGRAKLVAYEDTVSAPLYWDGTHWVNDLTQDPLTEAPTNQPTPPPPPPMPSQDSTDAPSPNPPPQLPPPPFPDVRITPGLPEEFADYFAGAIAWENPAMSNSDSACVSWQKVLALPLKERHFKSTWASFMLGKYWMNKDPQKAVGYFRQTRSLAANGFADSCGLAAASFGEEGLVELQRTNFEKAIQLYVDQMQTGDGTALNSLLFTAERALATNNPVMLEHLAKNPLTQRVITAYLISDIVGLDKDGQAARWLDAVEAAGVRDVDSAEELSLAAYQAGDWDAARRWAERAPDSPVSQWLEAKLLLRDGKISQAGAMLAKVVQLMQSKDDGVSNQLKDDLSVDCEESEDLIDASNEALGELGVIHLSQRDYVESLDALLRSGFWMDAAYVAERILTVDELKSYVDSNWPETTETNREFMAGDADGQAPARSNGWWMSYFTSPDETGPATSVRYLLARRLARLDRNGEARAYYPPQRRSQFDVLINDLKTGRDKSLPAEERGEALFAAAVMTRTNGMELLGTELEPDWLIYEGEYDYGDAIRTNDNAKLLPASADEIKRYTQHDVKPELRFHYRFQAVDLAVEAARFMPNNSEETARVLCMAGSWIKNRYPQRADPIYKELVRRCRNTQIGRQADLMRWFPVLDDSGNPIPYRPRAKEEDWRIFQDALGSAIDPGYFYYIGTIHMMDRQNGWAQSAVTLLVTNNWVNQWVFEQNAILRTTNGGASWKAVLCASPEHSLASFAYDKDTAWVIADYDESSNLWVLQTTDGGQSWGSTELTSPYAIQDCELSFPAANQGWILLMPDHGMNSMPGYLYHSDEYGEEWRLINSTENNENNWNDPDGTQPGFADSHPYLICGGSIAFQDSEDGWLLGQLTTTTRAFLFFTHDGGGTWQEQKFEPPPSLHDGLVELTALPRFFGTNGILETYFAPNDNESTNFYEVFYDTHDSGQTWQPTTPVRFTGASSFTSSETGWVWSSEAVNTDSTAPVKGILYRTDDGGQTWTAIKMKRSLENYLTHGERIVQLDFVDDAYGWAVTQDWHNKTRLVKTSDGGETWGILNP